MMIANIINVAANILIFLVIADSLVSFFLSPYHPVREALDRIVNPILAPIRRIVPLMGMMDLSPLILIILVEILAKILIVFLSSL
jgi:YggT family protein